MEHTIKIELENLKDLFLAEAKVIKPVDVRRLIIEDAIVDTGATGLCLPKPLVQQLGLIRAETAGIAERTVYSEVKYTVLERSHSTQITDLPESASVLLGHMILEALDLCVDMKKGLIHNPVHGGEWMRKIL